MHIQTSYIRGLCNSSDLNSDYALAPTDAVIALRLTTGSRPCDAATLAAADVSGDGRVTSPGALTILQAGGFFEDLFWQAIRAHH